MEILKNILDFSVLDVIDIVLVAMLLYYIYKLIRGTVAINIFIGIVIFYLFYLLVNTLETVSYTHLTLPTIALV